MTPPCPVDVGAVVLAPGGRFGRVVEIHPLSRTVLVELGDGPERFGWGELSPATARRWPPRERRARLSRRPYPSSTT